MVEDFVVERVEREDVVEVGREDVVEVVNEDPVGIEGEENPVLPIPSFHDELQVVGEHPVVPIPPLVCEGFASELPKFFENFPFQLLPSVPHVMLSGETFHHSMCANGNFQLETTAKDGVNEGCSSLGKDDKLTCILTRALKNQK